MGRLRAFVAAFAVAVLVAGCASTSQRGAAPAPDATLDVVTFNLYHDKADWPERLPVILAGLPALDPDVVALQEVLQTAELPNQARTIAEALGYHVTFFSVDPPGNAHRYGNALLTRAPPLAHDQVALAPFRDNRNAGMVRITVGGRPVAVYVNHPNYLEDAEGVAMRTEQFAGLLDFVDRTRGDAPVLLLGDFNALAGSPELAAIEARFDDALALAQPALVADPARGSTLNPAFFDRPMRIDHVMPQRGAFDVLSADIVLDPPRDATPASDHFGVHARLRVLP